MKHNLNKGGWDREREIEENGIFLNSRNNISDKGWKFVPNSERIFKAKVKNKNKKDEEEDRIELGGKVLEACGMLRCKLLVLIMMEHTCRLAFPTPQNYSINLITPLIYCISAVPFLLFCSSSSIRSLNIWTFLSFCSSIQT